MNSRWKYSFKKERDAKEHLDQAMKASGRRCFVRKITYEVNAFKIFTSEDHYEEYLKRKTELSL